MRLKKTQSCVIAFDTFLEITSVYDRNGLIENLAETCRDIVSLYSDEAASTSYPVLVWVCIDRNDDTDPPAHARYSHSMIDIRIDAARSELELERHFIGISYKLLNPHTGDVLKGGRAAFRQWLLRSFLENLWQGARTAGTHQLVEQVTANTRAWLYAETSTLYGIDGDGRTRLRPDSLPEPEATYLGPRFLYGPPLDHPLYEAARHQESESHDDNA